MDKFFLFLHSSIHLTCVSRVLDSFLHGERKYTDASMVSLDATMDCNQQICLDYTFTPNEGFKKKTENEELTNYKRL